MRFITLEVLPAILFFLSGAYFRNGTINQEFGAWVMLSLACILTVLGSLQ